MTEIFFSVENSYNVNFPEGGVLRISSDGDDRIRVKIKTPPPKIPRASSKTPPKFPGTKLTRKKIHVEFPSLKNLQKI